MKISDLSNEIIIMNLDKRIDRLNNCKNQALKYNFKFTKISSIDGSNIDFIPNNLRAGEYGLYLTYMNVLNYCINKNLDTVLIMEDDFQFDDDVETRLDEIQYIPNNWDLIYLGANHYHLGAGQIPAEQINKYIIRLKSSFCAHSIIFKYEMLVEFKKQLENFILPIDIVLKNMQSKFNCYSFSKNICKQYDSYSDIINVNPFYNARGIFD